MSAIDSTRDMCVRNAELVKVCGLGCIVGG